MAIFKREKKIEPLPTDSGATTTTPTSTPMSQAEVTNAEEKVQSLLGQNNASSPSAPADSSKPSSIFDNSSSTSSESPLELHEEEPTKDEPSPATSTPSEPASDSAPSKPAEDDHPMSTLPPEEEPSKDEPSPAETDEEDSSSTSNIPVSGSGEVALQDVDREVSELITKLESEAGKLDSNIADKNEKIKQLQAEIDEATNKKAGLDKKIQSLHQVVDGK